MGTLPTWTIWVTFGIAIAGFLMSLCLAVWTIIRDFYRDRKRLVIQVFNRRGFFGSIVLSNVGYRPITIISMDALDKNNERVPCCFQTSEEKGDPQFFKLSPGDTLWFDLDSPIAQKIYEDHAKIDLRVQDAEGTIHKDYIIRVAGDDYLTP